MQGIDKLIDENLYNLNFYRLKIDSLIKLKLWEEAEKTLKDASVYIQ